MHKISSAVQPLDSGALWDIAQRLVSLETVTDARECAQKIREAAHIVIDAATRILDLEPESGSRAPGQRGLELDAQPDAPSPSHYADVATAVGVYKAEHNV